MFFIITSIFIISPDTIANPNDEIVIFFEENVSNFYILLDGIKISGELTDEYFYYEPLEPFKEGRHILTIISDNDTIIYYFNVFSEYEGGNINSLNIGFGFLYNTEADTAFYPVYKEGKYLIYNLDFDIYLGGFNFSGSLIKDPEYYYSLYGVLNIKNKFIDTEIGIISPIFEEITLYGLTGIGGLLELKMKKISFSPLYLYSFEKDTLISEYKRIIFGLRLSIDSIFSATILKGYDDTTGIEGIPLFFPQEGNIISCYLGIPFKITPYFILSYSTGSSNRFDTLNSNGLSCELGLKKKNSELFFRFTDSLFIPIGNPFLEKGYSATLSTDFEIKKFLFSINTNLYPDFNDIKSSRFNGIISLSKDIKPFNINLSISHSEDNYYNSKITSFSNALSYRSSFFFLSANIAYSTSDTTGYVSVSTNNSFSFHPFYINLNLQYSNKRYNYHVSTLINISDTGLNIDIGGFYEDGKHQESYRFNLSRYF